jgi:hypothetical protein
MTYADDLDTPSDERAFDGEDEFDAEYEPVDNYDDDEYDFDDDELEDEEDDDEEDDEDYEEEDDEDEE